MLSRALKLDMVIKGSLNWAQKDAISFMIQNFTFMTSMGPYVDPLHGSPRPSPWTLTADGSPAVKKPWFKPNIIKTFLKKVSILNNDSLVTNLSCENRKTIVNKFDLIQHCESLNSLFLYYQQCFPIGQR
jgi:hypothetical protein